MNEYTTARLAQIKRHSLVTRALDLHADGLSLFAIARELGVTKEWLRSYAGLR